MHWFEPTDLASAYRTAQKPGRFSTIPEGKDALYVRKAMICADLRYIWLTLALPQHQSIFTLEILDHVLGTAVAAWSG